MLIDDLTGALPPDRLVRDPDVMRPLLVTPAGDETTRENAQAAFEDIITDSLALGGTVTGEHGVGLLKQPGPVQELGPAVLDLHRAVEQALDPQYILNPGKVIHGGNRA